MKIDVEKMTVEIMTGLMLAANTLVDAEKISFNAAYTRVSNARSDFPKAVKELMAKGINCGGAVKIVAREQPQLHSDWLMTVRKGA